MRERGLVPFAALVGLAIAARPWWEPRPPQGTFVAVAAEGAPEVWYRLDDPHLGAALGAAGLARPLAVDLPLADGDHVRAGARITVYRAPEPLVGDALDLAHTDAATFAALPGIGERGAASLVEGRAAGRPPTPLQARRLAPYLARP